MTRDALLDLILVHRPADAQEDASRERILDFLAAPGDLFDRKRFSPGHLTGSAFILNTAEKNLLLVHHGKLDRWLQPGGHGEPGETDPFAVALREAQEETGILELTPVPSAPFPLPFDLDVHTIPARKDEPAHLHLDIRYLFVAPKGADPVASPESRAIAWRPVSDLTDPAVDASLRRAAVKLLTVFRQAT